MAIIDAITYHNEADLFDLRYQVLSPFVDEFVVVESTTSFGGEPKDLNFHKIKDKYEKVKYFINEDKYSPEEIEFARQSPNTGGYPRWIHEFLQKESIKKALTHLNDDDMVFVGDVDELWESRAIDDFQKLRKLKLRVYTYFLNLRSDEEFWGPIQVRYGDMKNECLNHLRNNDEEKNTQEYYGWHFTNQGGEGAVRQKLYDQYNPEVFGNDAYYNLSARFGVMDYIGRRFALWEDESELPQYLKDHKDAYIHLFKPVEPC